MSYPDPYGVPLALLGAGTHLGGMRGHHRLERTGPFARVWWGTTAALHDAVGETADSRPPSVRSLLMVLGLLVLQGALVRQVAVSSRVLIGAAGRRIRARRRGWRRRWAARPLSHVPGDAA